MNRNVVLIVPSVGGARFELATSCSQGTWTTRLSYPPSSVFCRVSLSG